MASFKLFVIKLRHKTCGTGQLHYVRSCPGVCKGGSSYKVEKCHKTYCQKWTGLYWAYPYVTLFSSPVYSNFTKSFQITPIAAVTAVEENTAEVV